MEAVAAIELLGTGSAKGPANMLPTPMPGVHGVHNVQGVSGVQAGPNLSITDISRFDHAIYNSMSRLDVVAVQPVGSVEKGMIKGLDQMTTSHDKLMEMANQISTGNELTALADVARVTWHCTLFSVQCQVTSTVANRSADGVSQLFKQQS